MMVAMQKLAAPNGSTGNRYGSGCVVFIDAAAAPEQFPAGLRVLVVDDDVTCLKILERMLRKCRYHVTTCSQAMAALSLLRERKGCFDVVISDVHMPDMDGFKLLELVGLEMDLPVIMMSADGRTSAVMRGIKHGACDYLIKPVRMEELKNIWQHLVRKKWNENKDVENSGSFEDSDRLRRVADESECASSENDGMDASWKTLNRKRDSKDGEVDAELDDEDPSVSKKPRVVWSVELHQQFVNAVSQVGIDKAVPKRILELMNVPGLTRENVASHLQKFRLYLRRISGVTQNQAVLPTLFCNQGEASTKCGSLESLDFQALAASGQVPPQTLAALHAELFCHPSGNLLFPAVDQPVLLQASPQGSKFLSLENEVAFGQPLFNCQSGVQKQQFPPSKITTVQDMASEFSSWSSNQLGVKGSTNKHTGLGNTQDNSLLMQTLQHQQQHEHHPESFLPLLSDSTNAINVQPSCLVIPSQSLSGKNGVSNAGSISQKSLVLSPQPSSNIQLGSNAMLANSSSTLNSCTPAFHYSNLSSHLINSPLGIVHASNGDFKNIGILSNCYPPASTSSSSFCTSSSACCREPNSNMKIGSINRTPGHFPNLCIQDSELDSGTSVKEGQFRNLGFVGKGTCLPSRFAVDDLEPLTNDQSFTRTSTVDDVDNLKQEKNLDLFNASKAGNAMLPDLFNASKVGNAMLPNFPPSDSLGVLSKYV